MDGNLQWPLFFPTLLTFHSHTPVHLLTLLWLSCWMISDEVQCETVFRGENSQCEKMSVASEPFTGQHYHEVRGDLSQQIWPQSHNIMLQHKHIALEATFLISLSHTDCVL